MSGESEKVGKTVMKGMTKDQIKNIVAMLKGSILDKKDEISSDIENYLLQDVAIMRPVSKLHVKHVYMENSGYIIEQCVDKLCQLYQICNFGPIKDKYALLQV